MRLLIIEDNERLAALIQKGLEKVGFNSDIVTTSTDAGEALTATHYDIIALDLGLPDEDGLAVLRNMRSRGDTTPVIVLTARGTVRDRVAGLDAGADDYLVKPFALARRTCSATRCGSATSPSTRPPGRSSSAISRASSRRASSPSSKG